MESCSDSEDEDFLANTCIPLVKDPPIIIYKTRWLMLFIFMLNTAMNGCLFMSLTPINDIVRIYYNVPSMYIEWLSNICVQIYIVLALPISFLISKWGIRPIIISAASCHCIATVFHCLGYDKDGFHFVLYGQAFTAVAYSAILQMPAKISSLWFPEYERATATSIGVVMNLFGIAIGFLQPSMMVKDPTRSVMKGELRTLYVCQLVESFLVLLITLAYREKPPTPPCEIRNRESMTFIRSLKLLWNNKYFMSLGHAYGIYVALFISIFVLVNPLVTSKFPSGYEMNIGWMGFWNNIIAIVAFIGIGRLLDKYHQYQTAGILLNFFSMVFWIAFVMVLSYTTDFFAVCTIYIILGMCFLPYFAVGIEQAAEMTYPVPEEVSSTVLLVLANFYSFVFISGFGAAVAAGYIQVLLYIVVGLYSVSTVLAGMSKTELNRFKTEGNYRSIKF